MTGLSAAPASLRFRCLCAAGALSLALTVPAPATSQTALQEIRFGQGQFDAQYLPYGVKFKIKGSARTTQGHSAVQEPVAALERTQSDTASAEQRFQLLYDSLRDLSKDFANDVLKTIGSLLLVIGWLMMSEGSREFLRQNLTAWRTALIVIPVLAATNTVWLIDRFRVSENKVELLDGLKYLKEGYYASDRITLVVMVTDTIAHLALFAALFGLVYSQRGARSGSK